MEPGEIDKTQVCGDIFSEFLEVSIHNILYNRGLYPAGVFEKRKKYNVPVQMCLHPEITDYISKVIGSVKVMVQDGAVSMVTLVVLDPQQKPCQRFVFEIGNPGSQPKDDKYLFRLEESLRAFLLKLSMSDSLLRPLPEECSWVIHVHTKESTGDKFIEDQVVQDFPWVQADVEQTQLKDPTIVPLKTMTNEVLKMQLFVEDSSEKGS